MTQGTLSMEVRHVGPASIVDIAGDITAASEDALMDAYGRAATEATRAVVLNFSGLEYMNSGGIGLLVTLLVRAQRLKQKLLAFGLNEHYRQIFELTRLDEAIGIYDDGAAGRAARGGGGGGEEKIKVEGRRVLSPSQGFGRMWQKTYKVALRGAGVSPQEVISVWKEEFPSFWPPGNVFYAPLTGIAPGEGALLSASGPGG